MFINLPNLPAELATAGRQFSVWFESLDYIKITILTAVILTIYLFRKPASRWCIYIVENILLRVSITLSSIEKDKLVKTTEILLEALVVLSLIENLGASEFAGGLLRRLVISVIVIAVFATWYQLSSSFLTVFHGGRFSRLAVESDLIQRIVKFVILLFCITALLNVWDVDISGALTGIGVFGAGLAVAAKDPIQNLMAGINNLGENRFETGDTIEVEGVLIGVVNRIDLRSTLITGFDQIPRHVPNSELSNKVVLNLSRRKHRRIRLNVPLVLSSTQKQIEEVRDALKDYLVGSGDFSTDDDAPQYVHVNNLGDSSVDLLFYAWTQTADYANSLKVKERLSLKILSSVKAAGTDLAYPTQTIHTSTISTNDRSFDPVDPQS